MNDLKKILNNQSGVALMIVMTSIIILTAVMVNFTYEGQINKLKGVNIENRGQAKLTAEAGLKFAMTRLRLYKEAYNFLQKNKNAQGFVTQKMLNIIWSFPFIYPIPTQKGMSRVQKDAIGDFNEETILNGNMNLSIQNISNRINLNLIRVSLLNIAKKEDDDEDPSEENLEFNAEQQLLNAFQLKINKRSETDDSFAAQYLGMDLIPLVNNLKYYVSDPESLNDGSLNEAEFSNIGISPKRAPLTSYQELYTLPGWTDELAEMIQREFTIHGAVMIDINKINDTVLQLLIPELNEDEIKNFFKYRDDPEDPHFFNTLDDFKNYVVGQARLISTEVFNDRFAKFKAQGIKFGPSPSLFKIKSTGSIGRANYNIVAYVVLPGLPEIRKVSQEQDKNPANILNPDNQLDPPPTPDNESNNNKTEQITQLLEPRIVEIFIN